MVALIIYREDINTLAKEIPDKQKALVLQGGGALGAYEAGVFRAIYKKLIKEERNADGDNLFDIIAGTSSGALSGAVLINHFLANKSWKDCDTRLVDFWKGLRNTTYADVLIRKNPYIHAFWKYLHKINPNIATPEAARRFWSVFQFDFSLFGGGVPNAYQPFPQPNWRFLNLLEYRNLRYDYAPLRAYLSGFIDFPIKTEEEEPRFLVVSTDVQDYTSAVTFDSYKKPKGPKNVVDNQITDLQGKVSKWYSEYGEGQNRHLIFYDGGIGLDQLIASALAKYALDHPYMEDKISKTKRQFWDGGYLSNTPLRELIQSHRDYWINRPDRKQGIDDELRKVPDLEVYIVDLHATIEKSIPTDTDSIDDREHDILFRNKTSYDEKVAQIVTDYVDLSKTLMRLAKDKGASESDIKNILNSKGKDMLLKSTKRSGETRRYRDLLDGRFKITKIWHIGRQDDQDAIYGKFTDFSTESIDKLIEDGEHDATLVIQQ
jgi:NTE family protein